MMTGGREGVGVGGGTSVGGPVDGTAVGAQIGGLGRGSPSQNVSTVEEAAVSGAGCARGTKTSA